MKRFESAVAVVLLTLEGLLGGEVTLDASWRLLGNDGQELALERSTISELITGGGDRPLVRGVNRTLGRLAREIARETQSGGDTRAARS